MRWKEAFKRLRQANQSLAVAFDQFHDQLDDDARAKVQVSLQRYPFTARILDTGTPYWPDKTKIEDGYVVAKGLPVGVILSRSCEIFEYTIPLMPEAPKPTALLFKGDCIGLFELLDQSDSDAHGGQPDWSISAGSTSVRSIVNFDAAGTVRKLQQHFDGSNFDADRFKNCITLSEKAMFIPEMQNLLSDWTVDILFFNKFWFDYLFDYARRTDDVGFAACRLKDELYAAGWRSVSRIRAANTSFMRFFSPGLKNHADMHLVESSHALTVTVADAVYSRTPVYVLDRDGEDVAPVNVICQNMLAPLMEDPIAIRPAYLGGEHEVGYMPLDFISPYIIRLGLAGQSIRNRIAALAQKIRNASDFVIDGEIDLPILARLDEFLDNLAFRVPAAQNRTRENGERASAEFRLFLDEARNIKPVELELETYLQPSLRKLENRRCEFFRACARISAFRPSR